MAVHDPGLREDETQAQENNQSSLRKVCRVGNKWDGWTSHGNQHQQGKFVEKQVHVESIFSPLWFFSYNIQKLPKTTIL